MRSETCHSCGQSYPLNSLYQVFGQPHCETCGERVLSDDAVDASQAGVTRHVDPTICGWCGADYGQMELAPIVGVPACETCEARLRNWPFPLWVKGSFAALVCLAAFAFVYNFHYFKAYAQSRQAGRVAREGDFGLAAQLMAPAAQLAPAQFKPLASLYEALDLLHQDKPREALAIVQPLQAKMPHPLFDSIVSHAELSIAFDDHDYDQMLAKAQKIAASPMIDPLTRVEVVTSALACKYAATGDPAFRQQADEKIAEMSRLPSANPADHAEFKTRMQHRIETREIINSQEYKRRFPDGWKPAENAP